MIKQAIAQYSLENEIQFYVALTLFSLSLVFWIVYSVLLVLRERSEERLNLAAVLTVCLMIWVLMGALACTDLYTRWKVPLTDHELQEFIRQEVNNQNDDNDDNNNSIQFYCGHNSRNDNK